MIGTLGKLRISEKITNIVMFNSVGGESRQ
jgi:hypothetical protein